MLRHLKMKQQASMMQLQEQQQQHQCATKFNGVDQQQQQQQQQQQATEVGQIISKRVSKAKSGTATDGQQPRRVRGRRSSKPMMEKRRRARINECLDILKSYVLGDSANLNRLGIDTSARENQDEETIARTILKSSGLINRHRGRKNPNKLEKADILELTVDYVRRLHEQRDQLVNQKEMVDKNHVSPAITSPLSLNLRAIDSRARAIDLQATPPSPPPSSASSSPQPLLSISSNTPNNQYGTQHASRTLAVNSLTPVWRENSPEVLDLSDCTRARIQHPLSQMPPNSIYRDGVVLIEGKDGCWRPWNPNITAIAS